MLISEKKHCLAAKKDGEKNSRRIQVQIKIVPLKSVTMKNHTLLDM